MGKAELDRMRSSMVSIKVGERAYPAFRSNRCRVCMHPARALIEERLLLNEGWMSVSEWVSNHEVEDLDGALIDWPRLSPSQLAQHYNRGHCPVDTRVLHELSEQRMTELGIDYEQPIGRIVDSAILAKLVVKRGTELMVQGVIEPGIKDTIAAAKLLHDIESSKQEIIGQTDAYETAMPIFFNEARRVMTPEQWKLFGTALSGNEILKALAASDSEAVDQADVIEDYA